MITVIIYTFPYENVLLDGKSNLKLIGELVVGRDHSVHFCPLTGVGTFESHPLHSYGRKEFEDLETLELGCVVLGISRITWTR